MAGTGRYGCPRGICQAEGRPCPAPTGLPTALLGSRPPVSHQQHSPGDASCEGSLQTLPSRTREKWHVTTKCADTWGSFHEGSAWTSLVVQWLRPRLPMQGTRVQPLVREDTTGCRATKPLHALLSATRESPWAATETQ